MCVAPGDACPKILRHPATPWQVVTPRMHANWYPPQLPTRQTFGHRFTTTGGCLPIPLPRVYWHTSTRETSRPHRNARISQIIPEHLREKALRITRTRLLPAPGPQRFPLALLLQNPRPLPSGVCRFDDFDSVPRGRRRSPIYRGLQV